MTITPRAAALRTAAALCLALAAGCASGGGPDDTAGDPTSASATPSATAGRPVVPPPVAAVFDYQIGGAYPPPAGVRVVSRDRGDRPAAGLYSVCYVNAFQAQPDALDWWQAHHPDLVLRDGAGHPVMDTDWNEALLDTSTPDLRARLAAVVGPWIDGCAAAGFQAVELDNLDSYQRSGGRLTAGAATAFARLLVQRAHADGLAAGQKNTAELLGARSATGFDFAVTEECGTYGECGRYAAAYGGRVLDVEYTDAGFSAACGAWKGRISVVRRDHDVSPAGSDGYVYRAC
jgi:hypothetical protein